MQIHGMSGNDDMREVRTDRPNKLRPAMLQVPNPSKAAKKALAPWLMLPWILLGKSS